MADPLDSVDWRLLRVLSEGPRIGMLELSRRAGVARGTAQAHVDRLVATGVITSFGPHLDLKAMGYGVLAFTTIDIAQGRLGDVVAHLQEIPEVLEAHATTGADDLLCRVVARSNDHLQAVLNRILEVQGINRTTTVIALTEQIPYRLTPLVDAASPDATAAGAPTARRRRSNGA
ncbi:MAG TPA: Lrp/AsnC family transcriptional regulator [Acidimicrobiia bacterium]|nr:Lrp/AsnC family transcriptional regulator [Acidimicrobiia bacterium]